MSRRGRRVVSQSSSPLKRKRRQAQELSLEQGQEYEVHHRHPRSRKRSYRGNINEERNLSIIPRNKHISWHTITGNLLPTEWVKEVNDQYMPPDWYLVAVPRYKSTPTVRRRRKYCKDCECVVLHGLPLK